MLFAASISERRQNSRAKTMNELQQALEALSTTNNLEQLYKLIDVTVSQKSEKDDLDEFLSQELMKMANKIPDDKIAAYQKSIADFNIKSSLGLARENIDEDETFSSTLLALRLLKEAVLPSSKPAQITIQEVTNECNSCLSALEKEIYEELEKAKKSLPFWEVKKEENNNLQLKVKDNAVMIQYTENKRTLEETRELDAHLKNVTELCEQYNAVNAIKLKATSTRKTCDQRVKAVSKLVTQAQNSVKIQPGSRFREFIRNIKRILSSNKNKSQNTQKVGIFSTKSRAEQAVNNTSDILKKAGVTSSPTD